MKELKLYQCELCGTKYTDRNEAKKCEKYHVKDFKNELGDVAWYLALASYAIGYDLETILQMNVDKLKARYPHGFTCEESLHRKEGDV